MTNPEDIRLAKLVADKIEDATLFNAGIYNPKELAEIVRVIISAAQELDVLTSVKRAKDWRESDGVVLWWVLPVEQPPYLGTPKDSMWSSVYTHWTRLPKPKM